MGVEMTVGSGDSEISRSPIKVSDVAGGDLTKQTVNVVPPTPSATDIHEEIKQLQAGLDKVNGALLGSDWIGDPGLIRKVRKQSEDMRIVKVILGVIVAMIVISNIILYLQIKSVSESLSSIDARLRSVEMQSKLPK